MRKLSLSDLGRMKLTDYQQAAKLPLTIVLDDVRSALNVGSVFRTSDAFSIEEIILCGITARPPHKEILKTAIGATESVRWRYSENISTVLAELKVNGLKICAIEQVEGAKQLHEFEPGADKLAIIFGNEVNGVSENALGFCDEAIEIPQFGTKHSLNISVATGIVCWDILTKHKKSPNR